MSNTVNKVQAMQEDLGIGVGTVVQQRGSDSITVTQLELNWIFRSVSEIKALDVTMYTRVQLHGTGATKKYWYDATSATDGDDNTVIVPGSNPALGRWLLITDDASGFVPLAGTGVGAPITGTLEWNTSGANGNVTLSHDVDVFGEADLVTWRANGPNTGYLFIATGTGGIQQSFGFSAAGNFVLPSQGDSNTEVWHMGALEILGKPNTLTFAAQNALGAQTSHPVAFSTGVGINYVMHEDNGGWLQLPRTTVAGDNIHSAVTKDYVDAAIPPGGGEANTMSASGAGIDITLAKAAADLPIKSFIAGTDVTITEQADTITFNFGGGGGTDFIPLAGTLPSTPVTGPIETNFGVTFNGNNGTNFGATAGADPIYTISYADAFKTLLFLPNQTGPGHSISMGVWDGTTERTFNFNATGGLKLGTKTIDTGDDTSVITLGYIKEELLQAPSVSFAGSVHADAFHSVANITAGGSITALAGQFYLTQAQGTASNTLTRRDFVTTLDAANVKKTGSQSISGSKTFHNDIFNTANLRQTGGSIIMSVGSVQLVTTTGSNTAQRKDYIDAGDSDIRLKTNLLELDNSVLDDLMEVDTFLYDWDGGDLPRKRKYHSRRYGMSAQNVQGIFPDMVHHLSCDRDDDGESISGQRLLGMMYEEMVPILVKSMQVMMKRIEDLENA